MNEVDANSRSRSASPVKRVGSPVKRVPSPVKMELDTPIVVATTTALETMEPVKMSEFLKEVVDLDTAPAAEQEPEMGRRKSTVLTPLRQKEQKSMTDVVITVACKGSDLERLETQKERVSAELAEANAFFANVESSGVVPAIAKAWKLAGPAERSQLKEHLSLIADCCRAETKTVWYDNKIGDIQLLNQKLEITLAGIRDDYTFVQEVILQLNQFDALERKLQALHLESGIRTAADFTNAQAEEEKRLASLEREFESTRQELRNAEKELEEFKSKRDLWQRKGARKSMDQPATFKQRSKIFS
ncbi:hypothetical protein BT69DRAFT_650602 [Atractiella rhizophila]|nr:hypothetical protein BT69DRAFT_650602 [Atractiella rhizophila]